MLTGRRLGGTPAMSSPSMRILPLEGVSNPASIRRSVVLPQPEGPSRAKNALRGTDKETSSTAVKLPKRFFTCWTLTRGAGAVVMGSRSLRPARRLQPHREHGEDERGRDQHGRGGVDLGRRPEAHHRVDLDRERDGLGSRGEEGDDEVVERER